MTPEITAIYDKIQVRFAELKEMTSRVAALRKEVVRTGDREGIAANELKVLEADARKLIVEVKSLETEMATAVGLTEADLEALDKAQVGGDAVDRQRRGSVTGDQISPTDNLDNVLPAALEQLLRLLDPRWLRAEEAKAEALIPRLFQEPLSLIRGVRIQSEKGTMHRFAQMVLLARAYLGNEDGYDTFGGAMLVPQAAALGSCLPDLAHVGGDVKERLSGLWRLPSEMMDSTAYELLVAAACVRKGRTIEFISAGKMSNEKDPDIRVHDYPFPLVVECKRKQAYTSADAAEEQHMREVFQHLRIACNRRGLRGIVTLELEVEPTTLLAEDVVAAALQQPFALDPSQPIARGWGTLSYQELPRTVAVSLTRMYSPSFLQTVFGWNTDLPPGDGLICQVESPPQATVDRARDPLALVWTNRAHSVLRRRTRTAIDLFARAVQQIPPGEVGVIYICFQEGDRESVADDRTAHLSAKLHDWHHKWDVRVPITLLSRLVPRPIGHGSPDLIETGIQFLSSAYGDPIWFADFPGTVFTKHDKT